MNPPIGLPNNGGNCFFNSLTQCMRALGELPDPNLNKILQNNPELSGGNQCLDEFFYKYVDMEKLEKYFKISFRNKDTDIVFRVIGNVPNTNAMWLDMIKREILKFNPYVVFYLTNQIFHHQQVYYPQLIIIPKYYTFELIAVARHSGNMNGGHWWADVKIDNKVYNCNDSSISPGSLECNSTSTILFYKVKL